MIKPLAVALGIALCCGVASAQPKKAPARKAHAPKSGDKKAPAKAPKPDAPPADATPDAKPPGDATATPLTDPKPGATLPGGTLPGGTLPGGTLPGGTLPGGTLPGGTLPGGTPAQPTDPKTDTTPAGGTTDAKLPDATTGSRGMKTDEKAGTKLEKGTAGKRDVSDNDQTLAVTAFRQGNEQLNNGLFPQAVEKYRSALSHWDHPAIHYNLALALINLEQPLEVYAELNKAIEYGAEPLEKDKFDHAKEYLKLVEGQLADVEVSCDKIGAKVAVDGKEVFIAPGKYTAKVRVGKHTFFADKQGYNARVTAPFIGPGEKFRIELKLYTAEELTRYRRKWQNTWFPYAVAGGGALVGIIGGVLELSASSSFKDYDTAVARCNQSNTMPNGGCDANTPGLQGMKDSGNTKRTTGLVMYGIAGGAIAAGAVLAWLNRREAYQIRAEDLATDQVSVTPVLTPGMAGAVIQGHF